MYKKCYVVTSVCYKGLAIVWSNPKEGHPMRVLSVNYLIDNEVPGYDFGWPLYKTVLQD